MRKLVFLLSFLLAARLTPAASLEGPGALPIEINSTGQTTYENGLATARDNVAIHFGDTDIYSDFAQYDSAKRELLLRGNVRIYRGVSLYLGQEATYNVDSKAIQAHQMRSSTYPYLVSGGTVDSSSDAEYKITNGTFIDAAEATMAAKHFPDAAIYAPKASLGESVAAGAMWQVVCAALALRRQEFPLTRGAELRRAVVTTSGLNQQVAGLALSRS